MTTYFISDLHLEPDLSPTSNPASNIASQMEANQTESNRHKITQLFLQFLEEKAAKADALYILGDLFEVWIGDDDSSPYNESIIAALRRVSDGEVKLYFLHGNRDFFIGEQFAKEAGCQLLDEETVISLYGTSTLLMHGDTLCLDDLEYQKARQYLRSEAFAQMFLDSSIPERQAMVKKFREDSKAHTSTAAIDIMDVNSEAVSAVMEKHGVTRLIHGHTHRPAIHNITLNGTPATRMVLGNWHHSTSYLWFNKSGEFGLNKVVDLL